MPRSTILIAVENPHLARTLARWAHRNGLRPVWDYQGKTVEVAMRERPGVILLDLHQPNHDGRDILARLKASPATAPIEVVVMSARSDPWTRNECLALGALEYVELPFPERFMEVLARLVQAEDPKTAINALPEAAA